MNKTIFGYESTDDELKPHQLQNNFIDFDAFKKSKKRYIKQEAKLTSKFDIEMAEKRRLIDDLNKHCQNKRLKKNILQMDYIRLGGVNQNGSIGYLPSMYATTGPSVTKQIDSNYNPSITNASSDYLKLPRLYNDPVIDY